MQKKVAVDVEQMKSSELDVNTRTAIRPARNCSRLPLKILESHWFGVFEDRSNNVSPRELISSKLNDAVNDSSTTLHLVNLTELL